MLVHWVALRGGPGMNHQRQAAGDAGEMHDRVVLLAKSRFSMYAMQSPEGSDDGKGKGHIKSGVRSEIISARCRNGQLCRSEMLGLANLALASSILRLDNHLFHLS